MFTAPNGVALPLTRKCLAVTSRINHETINKGTGLVRNISKGVSSRKNTAGICPDQVGHRVCHRHGLQFSIEDNSNIFHTTGPVL